jgi:hypothetical protein
MVRLKNTNSGLDPGSEGSGADDKQQGGTGGLNAQIGGRKPSQSQETEWERQQSRPSLSPVQSADHKRIQIEPRKELPSCLIEARSAQDLSDIEERHP